MPTHTHPSPIDALIAWARAIRSREFLDANRTVADRFAEGLAGAGLAGTSFADLFALAQSVCVPPEALPDDLRSKDSVYLVITTRCNNGVAMRDTSGGVRFETCAHCLNGSGPHGASMSFADVDRVVANLPDRVREIEISGGEVLHPDVLPLTLHTLRACSERFGDGPLLSIQTNGDFLRSPRQSRRLVAELIAHGLRRIVVASMDIYHGRGRSVEEKLDERKRHYARIAENLKRESVVFVGEDDFGSLPPRRGMLTAHFFGADVEKWFGGFIVDDLVPNARAVRTGVAVESASGVRFCDHHAGAQGFL
ncbi:hypothetical protein FJZ36_02665, partial [Candidatus Poribacteria bacterium]|nr:hypothetical protein [Candidatus Poribacteria bacterium]